MTNFEEPGPSGLVETKRRHSASCREQEAIRSREAEILEAGFQNSKLREALIWAERQLCALVTEDDGSGTFIRGTGTELAGFGEGVKKIRAAIHAAKSRGEAAPTAEEQE